MIIFIVYIGIRIHFNGVNNFSIRLVRIQSCRLIGMQMATGLLKNDSQFYWWRAMEISRESENHGRRGPNMAHPECTQQSVSQSVDPEFHFPTILYLFDFHPHPPTFHAPFPRNDQGFLNQKFPHQVGLLNTNRATAILLLLITITVWV